MFRGTTDNKYAVPTEFKKDRLSHVYKHGVPMGLKKLSKYLFNLHNGIHRGLEPTPWLYTFRTGGAKIRN